MAVFPENMDKLDVQNPEKSLSIIENYIRYMTERTEFAMRNVTKTVSSAGVSSAEMYVLLTAMDNSLSALQSVVNGQSGTINSMSNQIVALQSSLSKLEGNVSALQSSVAAMESTLNSLDERVTALESTST